MSYEPYSYAPAITSTPDTRKKFHGLAMTAMILGIIGICFGFIPITFFFAMALGVLAFVFGCIGRKHKMGKAGVILAVISIALGIWGAVIVNSAVKDFNNDIDCINNAQTTSQMNACN